MVTESIFQLIGLLRNASLSEDKLRSLQNRRVRHTIEHAYKTVPYYRRLFDLHDIRSTDIQSVEDLSKIPVTRKEDLLSVPMENRTSELSNLDQCVTLKTSGSSGAPFKIRLSAKDKRIRVLSDLRSLMRNGLRFSDKLLSIVDLGGVREKKYWFQKAGIFEREYLDLFDDRDANMQGLLNTRCDALRGLTSELTLLGSHMLDLSIKAPSFKFVMTCADLLDPKSRSIIKQAFGTDPIDYYGAMEFGFVAWQCPQRRGYHINADLMIVEILKNGRPCSAGEEGELVITNLFSDTMPLIRYSVGDVAVHSGTQCSCGCTFPMIDRVLGRLVDCVSLPSGERVSPYPLICLLEVIPGLEWFQVLQEEPEGLQVLYLSSPEKEKAIAAEIQSALKEILKPGFQIKPRRVRNIPRAKGKFRLVKNIVNKP
jgi:phenylacetate-CoA ligase